MRRSSGYKKGQWFIISAVAAVGVFVTIATLFSGFTAADPSKTASLNEGYRFWNVEEAYSDIIENSAITPDDCSNMTTNLDEFKAVSESSLAKRGIFLYAEYTINDCGSRDVDVNVLLASDRAIYYEGFTEEEVDKIIPDSI